MLTESLLHFFESLGAEWVLWLLAVLAVAMLVVIVERLLFFARRRVDPVAITRQVVDALREGGSAAARRAVIDVPGMPGGVLRAAMAAYDDGVDSVEEVIHGAIAQERLQYDRFLPILGTLGNSAPFIGLFGTVIGILVAFSALGSHAEGSVLKAQVMGAIGEALVATAVGLAVAIPSVVSFNLFKNRIKVMAANTEGVVRLVLAHLKARAEGKALAGQTNGDDDDGINEINVVPLVDIMLVLLIIFMVTTQFAEERFDDYEPPPNVPVQLPSAASAEETNDMLLSLAMNREGALFLNGDETTLDGVKARVGSLKAQGAKLEAFVAADERLTHGEVIALIDALRLLGVADVSINTKPLEIE